MTNDEIKNILAVAREFPSEWKVPELCDAIELLVKQLEKCKEQRDGLINTIAVHPEETSTSWSVSHAEIRNKMDKELQQLEAVKS